MDIRAMSRKLRHAADVLDELLEVKGTPDIAKKIKRGPYKKKHWTQTPKGKKIMAKRSKVVQP